MIQVDTNSSKDDDRSGYDEIPIVILMMITLVVLFIVSRKFRKNEIESEKKEAAEFEALQAESESKKDL